jgi:hypothetical protein
MLHKLGKILELMSHCGSGKMLTDDWQSVIAIAHPGKLHCKNSGYMQKAHFIKANTEKEENVVVKNFLLLKLPA